MYYFIWLFCNTILCWYKRVLLRSEKKLASRKAWRLRASHTLSNRQPIKLSSSAKNGIKPMQGIKIGIKPMQSLSNRQPIKLPSSANIGIKPMLRHQNCQQTNAKHLVECVVFLRWWIWLMKVIFIGSKIEEQQSNINQDSCNGWMCVCV